MKFFIIFLFTIIYSFNSLASTTDEIAKKLNETKNIVFSFEQISNNLNEKGECYLLFPGNLKCIYLGDEGKEILVKDNSLYIIKHKFKRSYRYPIKNSAFNIVLNKSKILENLKTINPSKIGTQNDNYFYEVRTDDGVFVKIFFNKKSKILKGWETISYNQETVKFNIINPKINTEFKEKFILPNYGF